MCELMNAGLLGLNTHRNAQTRSGGADSEVVTGELLAWVISGACVAPVRGLTAEHVPVQGQVAVSVPAVMTRCKILIISMGTC